MSLVGILMFALNFLHLLAWPLLALGYPLFASIWAIERDSNWETKKLVTYWISFSLLSLFEYSFVNLLQWIHLWPHIKLMIICLLVIPYFDGAFFIYNHLVRPYLLLNPQVIVDEFRKWMLLLWKRDQFLAVAEKYIKGNGPEALEKLIHKEFETQKPNVDVEEIKAIAAATEKKESDEYNDPSQRVWEELFPAITDGSNSKEPDILEIDNKAVEVIEKKEVPAGNWLTTESEKTLNIHIQENKHKVTYEALKAKNQSNIVNFGSFLPVLASTTMTTDQPMEKPQKLESTNGLRGSTTTNHDEKAQGQPKSVLSSTAKESNQPTKQIFVPERSLDPTDNRTSTPMEIEGPDVAVAAPRELPDIHVFKEVQKEWTCAICQVTTSSKITLNMHRKGKKHKATIEALKAHKATIEARKAHKATVEALKARNAKKSSFKCNICNVNCTGQIDLTSHLRGKKHLEQVQVTNGKIPFFASLPVDWDAAPAWPTPAMAPISSTAASLTVDWDAAPAWPTPAMAPTIEGSLPPAYGWD